MRNLRNKDFGYGIDKKVNFENLVSKIPKCAEFRTKGGGRGDLFKVFTMYKFEKIKYFRSKSTTRN